jgi:uncharacterized NAD(P)/FAD-binding protein YdhS
LKHIAITGAGLSGRLLALNLLRYSPDDNEVAITLIDKGNEKYMGPAYSADEDFLLLNVPADRMGAYSEDPEHFLKWARKRGLTADKWDFLPRSLYREYILDQFNKTLSNKKRSVNFKHICNEVFDIEFTDRNVKVYLDQNENFIADKVVLALGNFLPGNPEIKNKLALNNKRYIQNPWNPGVFNSLSDNDTVFFIGTGQTMVDLAIILHKRNHKGKITAISRHGYLPMVHKNFEVYDSFYEEIKKFKNVADIFSIIRKHIDNAEKKGIDIRAVIDSLRPVTQNIWLKLPAEEKNKFLRHLFRYWEIIRSRIPPESERIIKELFSSGQLNIIAGKITDFNEKPGSLEVTYIPRGEKNKVLEEAKVIINCCGPESDYKKIVHPLVMNMMKKGLIRPGPANLGIDALPNGSVINRNGDVSDKLFTLGSTMRGVLWEVLAVPEIRVQAEKLAGLFLDDYIEKNMDNL